MNVISLRFTLFPSLASTPSPCLLSRTHLRPPSYLVLSRPFHPYHLPVPPLLPPLRLIIQRLPAGHHRRRCRRLSFALLAGLVHRCTGWLIVYRYAERETTRPASCGYVLCSSPPFKHTHYTFIRALNTSHIDGIECCTTYIYIYIHIYIYTYIYTYPRFPSATPRSPLALSPGILQPPTSSSSSSSSSSSTDYQSLLPLRCSSVLLPFPTLWNRPAA